MFLDDSVGNSNPLIWACKRINRVVKWTLAAEILSLVEAAEKAFLLAKFIEEILPQVDKLHITCFPDGKALYDAFIPQTSSVTNDWESKWQFSGKWLIMMR